MADTLDSPSSGNQFGFLTRKVGPIPVWAWGVIAVGIYYWYTHYGPGASSAASSATGSGSGDAVTETLNTTTGPTSDTDSSSVTVNPPPVSAPPPPVTPPVRQVKAPNHNPPRQTEPTRTVTVAKWPGKSKGGRAQWNTTLSGIASHEHVPLGYLEKDNPQVKNPNLVYPGEKINIPDAHQEHVYHEEDIRGK